MAAHLIIGEFQPGNPPSLASRQEHDLAPLPGQPDPFGIDAAACGLTDKSFCFETRS